MAVAWLVKWDWKQKWKGLQDNYKLLLASAGLFLIFVIGLFYSEDVKLGWKDVKVKTPLFILPVLFTTSYSINRKQIITAFVLMTSSAITATIIGFVNYNLNYDTASGWVDLRIISPFISLIRLSLILCVGFGLGLWGLIKLKHIAKWLLIIPLCWIVFILGYSQSLTGIVLVPIIVVLFIKFIVRGRKLLTVTLSAILLAVFAYSGLQIYNVYKLVFINHEDVALEKTKSGANYSHNLKNKSTENGHYVYRNINKNEVALEWAKRSTLNLNEIKKGYNYFPIVYRYLASKNLTKDATGIAALSNADIHHIENGLTNVFFTDCNPVSKRVYQSFREINEAIESGRFKGNSITMRFVFWKTGAKIFKDNWLFGVGTGDVKKSFLSEYVRSTNGEVRKFKLRSHNQYLSTGIALGTVGLFIFLFFIVYYWSSYTGSLKFLFIITQAVLILGVFWEDTLEIQDGVTIFALLTSLLLFEKKGR